MLYSKLKIDKYMYMLIYSEIELVRRVTQWKRALAAKGLKINQAKSKVVVCTNDGGEPIAIVVSIHVVFAGKVLAAIRCVAPSVNLGYTGSVAASKEVLLKLVRLLLASSLRVRY